MRIYLILPAAEHLRINTRKDVVPRRKMLRFSVLSLTTVAALTPRDHEVVICDENVGPVNLDIEADVVGISFMTGLAPRAYELADHFRTKGCITVAGGFHPTFCADEALEHFNIVVAGEAESVWPAVLRDIENGNYQKIYKSDHAKELTAVPAPRRELLEHHKKHYITTNAVQTGRGCNHQCRFCSVTAFFNNRHRNRPINNVIDELISIPRIFMFVDDNIIADKAYAKALFKRMIPMKKKWTSQCSIEIADDETLLELAFEAGCRGLFIGIESVDKKNLTAVDKEFNDPGQYMKKIKKITDAGIGVQAGMIVGLDSDDTGVFERNLKFLQKAGIGALQLAILTPQPGTPLRKQFEKENRIVDHDWSHYDYRHTVISPRLMTREELQNGADWLYHQFYRLDRIILRTIKAAFQIGLGPAYLTWRLNMTYRYNNKREKIKGWNPAAKKTPGKFLNFFEGLFSQESGTAARSTHLQQ